MIRRCENPRCTGFDNYGGRGITVCPRWRNSFADFLEDMGERPVGTVLDRFPNNNGNYEPGNCRWATVKESSRNRRSSRIVEVLGMRGCLAELAEHFGLPVGAVRARLYLGWSNERAFTTPLRRFDRWCKSVDNT